MLPGIQLGQQLLRRQVHEMFGGRQQGGIGPSRRAPVVLFFTDPETGQQHGYYDGWDDDGLYNYVGEGRHGDQRLNQGNGAILNHRSEGRSLEGFQAHGTRVTYLGEFELVDHHFTEAHESGDPTTLRQVVVFRLRPLSGMPSVELPQVPVTRTDLDRVSLVPVEDAHSERAFLNPAEGTSENERRATALLADYRVYLNEQGHEANRLRIVPAGESAPIYGDLWDTTVNELIVVAGGVGRYQVRAAAGRLLDCKRFVQAARTLVLMPAHPRPDLLRYLNSIDIAALYPGSGGRWERSRRD